MDIAIQWGGTHLEVVTEERDLGVIFDNRLDFDKHIRIIREGEASRKELSIHGIT